MSSLPKNRANALKDRKARKVRSFRRKPARHQRKKDPEQEVFSVLGHLTFLGNVVHYYENSPNKIYKSDKRSREVRQGACLDTGAQKTVIGERQVRA